MKIIIAMSGGVDSSISAFIIKKKNLNVEAIFMKNWQVKNNEGFCKSNYDFTQVKSICIFLNIKLHTVNFIYEYWNKVFKICINDYKLGLTPNPDVLCNKEIKFNMLIKYIKNIIKADFLATGHYCNMLYKRGDYFLIKGFDLSKDQTYFLYNIKRKFFKYLFFPLGIHNKSYIRLIAKKNNFINYNKKDSVGICFIEEKKTSKFLKKYIKKNIGYIKDMNDIIIDNHYGLYNYTIGQKIKNYNNKIFYVIKKNHNKNEIIVSSEKNDEYLYNTIITCYKINILKKKLNKYITCNVKIRHQQYDQLCVIENMNADEFVIMFFNKQKSIAIGQSIVVYKNNICICGGIIRNIIL